MAVDLGNLSIGIVPQLAALDALEARLAVLDRQPHIVTIGAETGQVTAAQAEVAKLGTAHQALGSRPVALGMDVSQVETARTSVQNLDNDLLSLVGTSSKVAAAFAAPVAFGALTKFAADYQTTLVTTSNQTSLTTADIGTMDKAIRELPTAGASLQSVATGFKNITDLGYSAADATKIMNETSKAATETGADQATVALAVTSAMKEYNASADEAAKYTNITAQAAKEANSSLQAWTEGTRTGVAVAAAYGVSLQEADAFMVALTRHGFDAAESATQLRGVIQHIVNPSEAAAAEIANIKRATGIDLAPDFGPTAIQVRGFANIMGDLQAVIDKTGDDSLVTRLIPALRGGQGALITVTQAAADAKGALTDLNAAATGALNPVDEGFARISQTTGYQFSATMKQLKLDMIDLGTTFLPVADGIIQAFNKIPQGAVKAAADIGLAFAAIKTATAVAGLIDTGIGLLGGGAAGTTAAAAVSTTAYTDALAANTEAMAANRVAQAGMADTAAIQVIATEATAIQTETEAIEAQTVAVEAGTEARKAFSAAGLISSLAIAAGLGYGAQQLDQASIAPDVKARADQQMQEIQKQLSNGQITVDQAIKEQQDRAAQMAKANDQSGPFGIPNPNIPLVGRPFPTGFSPSDGKGNDSGSYSDTEIKAQQEVIRQLQARQQRDEAAGQLSSTLEAQRQAAAVPGSTGPKSAVPSPDEYKATLKQEQDAAAAFAKNQADYAKSLDKATMDARTQGEADALKARNQANTDAAKVAKDTAQAAGDAQVAAATKVADAWKAAETAVGSVDPSKGIQGLIDAAPGLDAARDALSALGQSDGALTDLTKLADVFQSWAADTDKATAALKGYDLTLTETNKAIQGIGSLKSEYLAALDAAEKRQKAGTADASDIAIINARTTALGALDQQTGKLQQQGNVDILGKLANLPDYAAINANLKNVVTAQGGGAAVLASLTADKAQASKDITGFEQTWHDSIEKIKSDTKDAVQAIDDLLKKLNALPLERTITIRTVTQDAPGSASTAQGNEGTGASGAATSGAATPPRTIGIDYAGGGDYGGYGSAAGGGGAGGTISFADYQRVLANYPGSPINNRGAFGDLTGVAAQTGVDPRVLMAIMQTESGYGANAGLIGQQFNYGGMGVNDRGFGHDSGVHATDGGPEYEGYNDFKSFLMDISAWVKQYGSSFANYQTADGGQAKNSAIAQLQAALPLSGTSGGAGGASADGARGQILDLALQSVGQDKLVNYCEQFVEETVQTITGKRGATGQREESATSAFQHAAAMGLETHTPQMGDLVYYPSAAGGAGHVAIYMGNGQQVSTYDGRPTANGDQYAIHTESVAQGARYISVGLPGGAPPAQPHGATYAQSEIGQAASNTPGPAANVPPGINAAAAGANLPVVTAQQLQAAMAAVNAEFAKMDAPSIKGAKDSLTSILPVLTDMQAKARQIGDTPLTDTEKQQAAGAAWQQGLQYEAAYAQMLQDIENHTGNLAVDTQKVADIVGGPMADAYGKAALASAQITAATSTTASLTAAHDLTVAQRQLDDQAASRAATIAGWAEQDKQAAMQARQQAAQNRLADQQTAENDRYTRVSRDEQDRQRDLQFSQQVQATDLQNKLADLQKSQQNTTYNRTAQEQLQEASIRGAGTNQQASQGAATLAGMHDRDLAQKDLDNKAVEDIQLQIREQAKAANLESYNLQTETIAEQRKHENIIANLTAQGVAQQRTFAAEQQAESQHQQQIQRSAQMQQWQLQDERAQEDAAYKSAIDAQTKIKDDAQASLDAANQALTAWQQTGQVVAAAASSASSLASNGNPTNLGNTASNVTAATFGQGGTYVPHLAGGGSFVGSAVVGDATGGGLTPYSELVNAPFGATVVPLNAQSAGGGTNNFNFGDVSLDLSEQDKAEIKAFVTDKIAAARRADTKHKRAVGLT